MLWGESVKVANALMEKTLYIINLVGNFFLFKYIIQTTVNTLGIDDKILVGLFLLLMFLLPFITKEFTFYYLKNNRSQELKNR